MDQFLKEGWPMSNSPSASHSEQNVDFSPHGSIDNDISDYTYASLELDMSDDEGYLFSESDEETDEKYKNAFFSAVPEEARINVEITREITQTRERKWTVYDLASANFLPAHETNVNQELMQSSSQIMSRCAPMNMILQVCDIFTNVPSEPYRKLLMDNFNHIVFEDRSDGVLTSPRVLVEPLTRGKATEFISNLANAVGDDKMLNFLEDWNVAICKEFSFKEWINNITSKNSMADSIVCRLLRACGTDMTDPMLSALCLRSTSLDPGVPLRRNATAPNAITSSALSAKQKKRKKLSATDSLLPMFLPRRGKKPTIPRLETLTPEDIEEQEDTEPVSPSKIQFDCESSPKISDVRKTPTSPRRLSVTRSKSVESDQKLEVKFEGSAEIQTRKSGRKRNKSGNSKPKSPRRSIGNMTKLRKSKEASRGKILLTPKPSTEHIQILRCNDKTFMVRHRRSDNAESGIFPCPLVIEWQTEFLFNETGMQLLAMYPKIISLEFSDKTLQEKYESIVLGKLESRLFS